MLPFLIRKELAQLRRDRKMFPIIFVAPILQLLIFGYAAVLDVVEVSLVVCDQDHSPSSRELVGRFEGSAYFDPITHVDDPREIDLPMTRGEAGAALVIPPGFGAALHGGGATELQLLIDGADSVKASQGMANAVMITGAYGQQQLEQRLSRMGFALPGMPRLEPRVWYNPELHSRNYMVPAIFGLILVIMTTMLTSMAIVREKENGTMEQLIVTPIEPVQLILGKLLPFVGIGLVQVTVVLAVAILWFQVPFRGNLLLLYLLVVPFLLNTLGIGLLISTVSATQQQAMLSAMFLFMLPMIYFSGFVFPIESMPGWVQPVTYVIPLRYFLNIIRGIFLRGVGLEVLWFDATALTGLGVVVLGLAVSRFRKTLD